MIIYQYDLNFPSSPQSIIMCVFQQLSISHANHHTWIFYFQPARSFDLPTHQQKFQTRGVSSKYM